MSVIVSIHNYFGFHCIFNPVIFDPKFLNELIILYQKFIKFPFYYIVIIKIIKKEIKFNIKSAGYICLKEDRS